METRLGLSIAWLIAKDLNRFKLYKWLVCPVQKCGMVRLKKIVGRITQTNYSAISMALASIGMA